ncbi:molybdopterin-dependent oxidoreductase [Natronomonas sp. EA1]|uniref:molybdopterin-dependent oxidoreductase n=1 Tax=Natronomonas sp. EA1 TaxID=3421655 RepID=UPI003EB75DBD
MLPPRLVDGGLLAGLVVLLATGVTSLVSGHPSDAWVFTVHAVAGVVLVGLLAAKLWRVRDRIRSRVSVLLAIVAGGALLSGLAWVFGASLSIGPWGLLNLHIGLGLLVVPFLVIHLRTRFHLPRRADFADRREALSFGLLLGAGMAAWRVQGAVNDALDTVGARRRFTGSRERGSRAGNRFPITSWVADDPGPIRASEWTLTVTGGPEPLELTYGDLTPETTKSALLDCTSGWYSEHDWQGVRVGDLLDMADAKGKWVQFRSVTGYRWSFPIAEARESLLATHVDGERLSHGHGFPIRLVVPDRRGFQWVKWVTEVRVSDRRDRSEWLAVFVSGF